jgi:hypothetical protein
LNRGVERGGKQPPGAKKSRKMSKNTIGVLGIGAALILLVSLRWPIIVVPVAGIAVVAGILWTAQFTRNHTKWLILPLLLNEALSSVNIIDDSIRPILRYSMLALFCVPMLMTAFRSGALGKGGFRLYMIYFVWGAVTILYSIYPFYSAGRVASAALLFTSVVAITSNVADEDEIYELIGVFWIGSAIIMVMLAVALVAFPADLSWKLDDNGMVRFSGLFNSPNQVGEVVLTTVSSALVYWPAASKRTRWLILLSILAALGFDALADSRSPFIALVVGVLLLAIDKYRMRAVVVAAALLFVGLLISKEMTGSEYVSRGEVTTLTGRTEIWKYVVHAIRERPLTGWGYEVEGQIFQNHDFPLWEEIWDQGPRSSLHNGYLSRAVGVGIPATLLWLFIVARALGFSLFDSKAPRVLHTAAIVGAVPIMITNMVESTAGDCRYSVGLLLALIWALSEYSRLRTVEEKAGRANSPISGLAALRGPVEAVGPRLEPL